MKSKHFAGFALLVIFMMLLAACAGQTGGQAGTTANLQGTEWVLTSLNGQEPIAGSTVTLSFEQAQLGGKSGCNSYGADYSVGQDGKLTIAQAVMTEMACMEPAGIMEQETSFLSTLTQAASFQVNGDQLELKNAAGETILVFTKA